MSIKSKTVTQLKRSLLGKTQAALLMGMILFSCKDKPLYPGPLSPEESMKTFHFAEDMKAEIFATEPLVIDPVSMEFDEYGNAYVVGMLDAYKPDSTKGKGTISILKDLDGDGRADTAIIFADGLREATSILPWEGGLLICAAPNIMFYKDTDGDGRADKKEIVFSGFFNKNEEAQISNLRFGVDNWIYANNNGQASEVTFNRLPNAPKLDLKGSDFRFRLDRNQFELTTGPGQYGLAIDDWGHRFFTQNTLHIQEAVVPKRYLLRNPNMPSSTRASVVNVSDHELRMYQLTPAPYWRAERSRRRNEEFQKNKLDRVEHEKDYFTGASGGTFYGGDALPEEFYGNIFTGDVAGSLVHRDILTPSDSFPYMVASRAAAEKDKEFMATTDSWVRPASFTVGPDGDLYMIDMYRQHIETPLSIPADLQTTMDFDAGNKEGRIYRFVPKNAGAYKKPVVDLRNAKTADLVQLLSHKNQWWRLQAQRLLLERQDKSVIPDIKALIATSEDPRTRLHAIYALEGMNALDAEIVKAAMKDPSAGVRENAAILSERYPTLLPQLIAMTDDSSVRVAFQATLSLGQFKDKSVAPALAKVLANRGYTSWFRTAVLSSEAGSSVDFLKSLEQASFFNSSDAWKNTFMEDFSNTVGNRNQTSQNIDLLNFISRPSLEKNTGVQAAVVKGLAKGFQRVEGLDDSSKEKLKSIEAESANNISKAIEDLKSLYTNSSKK